MKINKIEVIPVIDIKDGVAVSAIRGERDKYMPLKSVICSSANPLDVAMVYESMGFKRIYIADLDGILKNKPNLELLEKIAVETNLEVMADIGIASIHDLELLRDTGVEGIVGTETMSSLEFLDELPDDFILSIDMKDGELLSNLEVSLMDLLNFLRKRTRCGEVILLDLSLVGTYSGVNIDLCRKVTEKLPCGIVYGGGVKNVVDIHKLCVSGIKGVLVGSGIHCGKITMSELSGFL